MTAVARTEQNTPAALVQQYQGDFAVVLPSHIKPETWCRVAIGALRRDRNLEQAARQDPASFLGALLDAARRGLEPGTEQYYLVPQKVKGQMQVRGQMGYQGVVELIYRAGAVSSVIVEVVRENDKFSYVPGRDDRPTHEIDWFGKGGRGELLGAYAYAVMKDGATSKVVILNRDDIERAKASSQGASSAYSPWVKHEESMWLKTAAHRLAKWVPTSAEYMREQLRAVKAVEAEQVGPGSIGAVRDQPVTETGLERAADPVGGEHYEADEVTGEVIDEQDPPAGQYASYDESGDPTTEPEW
ncbi:recombinase RecT [Intrasporangium flavum]|uniref:recombinase RecT n=1 Tax=Intrasporangium flavum TaxID=1428657 RepID=UPI00096EBD46|nr:recombinase RecT [Intrasporangium flavum]